MNIKSWNLSKEQGYLDLTGKIFMLFKSPFHLSLSKSG